MSERNPGATPGAASRFPEEGPAAAEATPAGASLDGDLRAQAEETLELPKVRAMLAGHAHFFLTRARAMAIHPRWRREDVERLQDETAQGALLLSTVGDIGLGGLDDPRPLVQRAALDGVLTGPELIRLASVIDAMWEARVTVMSTSRQVPLLAAIASRIYDLRFIRERVLEKLTENGTVRDSATPGLARMRRRVAVTYNRLVGHLERVATSGRVRPALQSNAIATRGDRLVLEVKVENRKHVPGIVHDVSNTGATLFVEPFGAVDLCNEWRETSAMAAREEEKVLRRLSHIVGDRRAEILQAIDASADLDFVIARARLARAMHANRPAALPPGGEVAIRLVDARHPLLGEGAVPATFNVGPGFRALVITGPNTGGKTVALKTAGLLAMMHQSGLQIPAAAESELAVFDGIFADIGDAQSIERSVSTFSSHMGNVVRILAAAGPRSLVLLDELGTGTDPEEGAALARAVVTELARRDVPSVATTHHRVVAEYATRQPGIENASLELDPDTMLPTYHLVMGLPGRSYALSVARRLGMPERLLRQAESMLGAPHREAEALLKELQRERARLAEQAAAAERERAAADRLRHELEARIADVERRQDDLIEETRRVLRLESEDVRNSLRRIVHEAREAGHYAAARHAADEVRRTVRNRQWFRAHRPRIVEAPADEPEPEPVPEESVSPGDIVEVRSLGARAEVLDVAPDGSVDLLMGSARVRVDIGEVRRVEGEQAPPRKQIDYHADLVPLDNPTNEIDLRGRRAHEVHDEVTRFLDQCALMGLTTAKIIHGRGTGAVREAVREALAHHPVAAAFGPAEPAYGGDAVTLVELA